MNISYGVGRGHANGLCAIVKYYVCRLGSSGNKGLNKSVVARMFVAVPAVVVHSAVFVRQNIEGMAKGLVEEIGSEVIQSKLHPRRSGYCLKEGSGT